MPVYDYKCPEHGVFNELATMAEHASPAPCPQCLTLSPRVIILPSHLIDTADDKRQALERNEIAQHEPVFSNTDSRAEIAEKYNHKSGCGCNQDRNNALKLMFTEDGKKMFPTMRPWMISH